MQKRQFRDNEEEVDGDVDVSAAKKIKRDTMSTALVSIAPTSQALTLSRTIAEPGRTSALMAPEVSLLGHEGAVYSIAFDPSGNHLCSGSFDKQILLWDVYGNCDNYNVLRGHRGAVLQVCWPTANSIVSCSADKTVACWDANKGIRTRKFVEHTAIVNTVTVAKNAPYLIASGSDDCTVILWDARSKQSIGSIYHDYQVCAVALAADGQSVYTGGIDNIIRRFDLRAGFKAGWDISKLDLDTPDLSLQGHTDTITGLSLSPDGNHLLSNAMDSQLRVWDVRPFSAGGPSSKDSRCENVASGGHHGAEKVLLKCAWSPDQEFIAAGSADRLVHTWDTTRYEQQPSWPGHKASVNEVIFHPTDRIIASCGSDKQIILGELPAL